MQQVNFTTNPNNKILSDHFGDARLKDNSKYFVDNTVEMLYRNRSLGYAKIVAVSYFKYSQLRDTFSYVNCGKHAAYQASLLLKFYGPLGASKDLDLVHVVFEWTVRNMEQHAEILKAWWEEKVAQQPYITEFKTPIE